MTDDEIGKIPDMIMQKIRSTFEFLTPKRVKQIVILNPYSDIKIQAFFDKSNVLRIYAVPKIIGIDPEAYIDSILKQIPDVNPDKKV